MLFNVFFFYTTVNLVFLLIAEKARVLRAHAEGKDFVLAPYPPAAHRNTF